MTQKLTLILPCLVVAIAVVCSSGCAAKARKNWFGDLLWGVVESKAYDNNENENRDFREPGLTRQEAKERYQNDERYQSEQNSFISDYKEKEATQQRERDAALLKGWLQANESSDFLNRDRSKDLF